MLSGYKQMAQYLHDFSITSTKIPVYTVIIMIVPDIENI